MKKLDKRTRNNEGNSLNIQNIVLKPSARKSRAKLSKCTCGNQTLDLNGVCAVCLVFQRVASKMDERTIILMGMETRMELYGGVTAQ